MNAGFRAWVPSIAILIVAVSLVLAYGVPAARQRLEQRTEPVTLAAADAITGEELGDRHDLVRRGLQVRGDLKPGSRPAIPLPEARAFTKSLPKSGKRLHEC